MFDLSSSAAAEDRGLANNKSHPFKGQLSQNYSPKCGLLLSQEIGHLVFVNDLLFEGVSAGFGAAYSADNLGPVLSLGRLFQVFYFRVL